MWPGCWNRPGSQLWCATGTMVCPMCQVSHVCHGVPCEPLHLQLPITCPLYSPAITHHPHYTPRNTPVTLLLPFIAQPLHTCPLTFDDLCSLHTHCRVFFLHLHIHYTPIEPLLHTKCRPTTPVAHPSVHSCCTPVPHPLPFVAVGHTRTACVPPPWRVSHRRGVCHTAVACVTPVSHP